MRHCEVSTADAVPLCDSNSFFAFGSAFTHGFLSLHFLFSCAQELFVFVYYLQIVIICKSIGYLRDCYKLAKVT